MLMTHGDVIVQTTLGHVKMMEHYMTLYQTDPDALVVDPSDTDIVKMVKVSAKKTMDSDPSALDSLREELPLLEDKFKRTIDELKNTSAEGISTRVEEVRASVADDVTELLDEIRGVGGDNADGSDSDA